MVVDAFTVVVTVHKKKVGTTSWNHYGYQCDSEFTVTLVTVTIPTHGTHILK